MAPSALYKAPDSSGQVAVMVLCPDIVTHAETPRLSVTLPSKELRRKQVVFAMVTPIHEKLAYCWYAVHWYRHEAREGMLLSTTEFAVTEKWEVQEMVYVAPVVMKFP